MSHRPLHASSDTQSSPAARLGAHFPFTPPAAAPSQVRPKTQSVLALHAAPGAPRAPHLPLTHESPDGHAAVEPHALPAAARGWQVAPSHQAPAAHAGWWSAAATSVMIVPKGCRVHASPALGGFLHAPSTPTL